MSSLAGDQARRQVLVGVIVAIVLGVVHHADHIIRGNHMGWPLISQVTPFTFSLLLYPIALIDLYLIFRGRAGAGSLAFVAALGLILVGSTHLGPSAVEPIQDVYGPYQNPVLGAVAVTILLGLMLSLLWLLFIAFRVRNDLRTPAR